MNSKNQELGRWGEQVAAKYLLTKGYRIEEINVRTEYGEIDLIAQREGVIVFVEVKTRTGDGFGYPEEAITPQKAAHMIASAQAFIQTREDLIKDWRIDVIAIRRSASENSPEIRHFENAVQG